MLIIYIVSSRDLGKISVTSRRRRDHLVLHENPAVGRVLFLLRVVIQDFIKEHHQEEM